MPVIRDRSRRRAALQWPLLVVAMLCAYPSFAVAQTASENTRRIDVTVLDSFGLPILGARVSVSQKTSNLVRIASSSTEQFTVQGLAPGEYTLRVSAPGFQLQDVAIDLRMQPLQSVEIRLKPAGITEELVVTATRSEQRVADVPASISILNNANIERSPAVVADDVLREVPTFSLFRRTSSLAANPTAQGVSLRGVGPSGVSRTLVLLDGVPFNDPFGGWVYWTRVPMMNADRIEVVDGATSSLYGNYAMGGVINIVTNRAVPRTIIFKPQYGNQSTPKMDLFASDMWGKFGVTVDAATLYTDGYNTVAPEERGPIDNNANVRYGNVDGKIDYAVSDRANVFFRGGVFDEKRNNGKIGELNDTTWKYGSGGAQLRLADGSNVESRLFFDNDHFHQNTFAVPASVPPRSQEFLTLDKVVPTDAVGAMTQWSRVFQGGGPVQVVTAGGDFRWVSGDSDELTYAAATGLTPQVHRVAGGSQKLGGAFIQDVVEVMPRLQLTVSARGDGWLNYNAHDHETTLATGLPTAANRDSLPNRSDTALSPRAAALYRVTNMFTVWGSVGKGFRAPTLKELYSPFRVGNVLTLSNDQLGPERLTGVEAGVSVAPTDTVTVRATWFNNRVTNPVANVTTTSNGLTRQLINLGSTNIGGFQTDVAYRVTRYVSVGAAYLFDVAKVHASAPDAAGINLTGKYLPQVPRHRGSFQVNFTHPRYVDVSFDTEFVSHQFDDDQNVSAILPGVPGRTQIGLPGFALVNMTVSRSVNRTTSVFFGAENLLNTVYYVGTNPTTIGTPRLVNGGIRLRVGR
jgi:outer membrane cobalamin receptor